MELKTRVGKMVDSLGSGDGEAVQGKDCRQACATSAVAGIAVAESARVQAVPDVT